MAALEGLNENEKAELVCSLSALLCADAGVDINDENLNAVIKASGNKVASYWTPVFVSTIEKAEGVDKFCKGPGSGGGGGGGGGGDGGAAAGGAAAAAPEPEEEEEVDMGGGMSMFGEEEGGGGGDY